jgi:hypothetical protein
MPTTRMRSVHARGADVPLPLAVFVVPVAVRAGPRVGAGVVVPVCSLAMGDIIE